jgi:hypothetical protein
MFRRSCRDDTCNAETEKDASSTNEPPPATENPSPRRRKPRPKVPINFKVSMSVNWASFWRGSSGGMSYNVFGEETSTSSGEERVNDSSEAVDKGHHAIILHLPIYDNDFVTKNLPRNFAMMKLFTLQPAQSEQQPMKLGAYIVAPRSAWAKIDASGMVDEYLWSFRRNVKEDSQTSTTGVGVIQGLADELVVMSSNEAATLPQEDSEEVESSLDPQSLDSLVIAQSDCIVPHRITEYEPLPPPPRRFAPWTKLLRRQGIDASQGSESSIRSCGKWGGNESVDDETVEDSGGETGDELSPLKEGNDEALHDESPSGVSGSQEQDVTTLPLPRQLWGGLGNGSLYRKD